MILSRKTQLDISFNGKNVSKDLENYLEDWTFTDNLSGQADDLQIRLEDKNTNWLNNWFPVKGTLLQAYINKKDWKSRDIKTNIGKFEIDEIDANGPPTIVNIKASSVPQSTSIRGETKSKAWEKTNFKIVASDIAKRNKLKLYYLANNLYKKDRYEQNNETDLSFLYRVCSEEGLCLKISNQAIVILDEADYESKPSKVTINRRSKDLDEIKVIDWIARTTFTGVYSSCRVEHSIKQKNKTKKVIKATFTPPKPPKVGRTLIVKTEVKSQSEAQFLAKKKLREANKNATTVKLIVMSETHLYAGTNVNLKDFGKFNGKYIITQVVYSKNDVTISLRKCLEGY